MIFYLKNSHNYTLYHRQKCQCHYSSLVPRPRFLSLAVRKSGFSFMRGESLGTRLSLQCVVRIWRSLLQRCNLYTCSAVHISFSLVVLLNFVGSLGLPIVSTPKVPKPQLLSGHLNCLNLNAGETGSIVEGKLSISCKLRDSGMVLEGYDWEIGIGSNIQLLLKR